jgi:hypothetical protein
LTRFGVTSAMRRETRSLEWVESESSHSAFALVLIPGAQSDFVPQPLWRKRGSFANQGTKHGDNTVRQGWSCGFAREAAGCLNICILGRKAWRCQWGRCVLGVAQTTWFARTSAARIARLVYIVLVRPRHPPIASEQCSAPNLARYLEL